MHLLNFEFRYDPGRQRVKEIIDSGAIGRVIHMNWNFYNSFSRPPQRKHGWQFERPVRRVAPHQRDAHDRHHPVDGG